MFHMADVIRVAPGSNRHHKTTPIGIPISGFLGQNLAGLQGDLCDANDVSSAVARARVGGHPAVL